MKLNEVLIINGKPGLYKILVKNKNSFIVESLGQKKRFVISGSNGVGSFENMAIYTQENEEPLIEVLKNLYLKMNRDKAPTHKSNINILKDIFESILPSYDRERVYDSVIRKVFQWYNILIDSNIEILETEKIEEE